MTWTTPPSSPSMPYFSSLYRLGDVLPRVRARLPVAGPDLPLDRLGELLVEPAARTHRRSPPHASRSASYSEDTPAWLMRTPAAVVASFHSGPPPTLPRASRSRRRVAESLAVRILVP